MGKGFVTRTTSRQAYIKFLEQVLQAARKHQADPQVLYSLLQRNLDKLDDGLAKVLHGWARAKVSEMMPIQAQSIAADIAIFIWVIWDFPLGNQASNSEIAITGYKVVTKVFTRNTPEWAGTQNQLGVAYLRRIQGERAENLEAAISCYLAALEVRTREAFPEEWARTQHNLGVAYINRIQGERAENLEAAIRYLSATLEINTREAFPKDWADTQNNLGNACLRRIQGERAENVESAIRYYSDALEVRTREAFPQDWAITQTNLGAAYRNRINGNREQNIEDAIAAYQEALKVHIPDTLPEKWAETQNNLGNAYCDRIRFSQPQNLEKAIDAYKESLKVRLPDRLPEKWAETHNNLGAAYSKLGQIEEAIKCYQKALIEYTREALPEHHVGTLFNLGFIYQIARKFSNAYDAFTTAIDTIESLRVEIVSGDEAKQKLAEEWNQLYRCMVKVCLELGYYDQAIEYVERSKARNLVELLATRDRYPKGDIPQTVLNELNRLRREITAEQRWLEIQQRNRSQQLGDVQTPTRDRTHLNQLQEQLDKLIARDIAPIDPDFRLTQKVEPIRYSDIQALTCENTAILEWYILGDKFLTFIITPQSQTPIVWQSTLEDFQDLINWSSEYLKAYLTDKTQWRENLTSHLQRLAEILHLDEILSQIPQECDRLILIPHRFLHLFPLHALPLPDLGAKHSGRGSRRETTNPDPNGSPFPGTQPKQTSSKLRISLEGEAFALKNFGEKTEVIDANASPLQGLCLLDRFSSGVSYAPSCQLVQQAQNRQRPDFTHLFAIQNPTFDLTFTDLEVQAIQQHFHARDVLVKNEAKKSAIDPQRLSNAHCAHFSCHGYFNFNQPLLSALLLADSHQDAKTLDLTKCLTLDDLFSLDLSQCRLVFLSACETGLTDLTSISDEYIGLPSGFLVAGSPSVVSSLWTVSDLSTALLTIKFYENLQTSCRDSINRVSLALNQAQKWLRNLTCEEFEAVLKCLKPQIDQILTQLPAGKRFVFEDAIEEAQKEIRDRQPYSFANSFYWAAFTATGL